MLPSGRAREERERRGEERRERWKEDVNV